MDVLLQGLLLGGLYCAISLGLSLVFGVLGMVNLAHGPVLVAGALLTSLTVSRAGGDPLLIGALVALALGALAYAAQRWIFTPILRVQREAAIPATFGVGIAIQSILLLQLGSDPRVVGASYATSGVELLGTTVRWSLVISLAIAALLTIALTLLLRRTRFGAEVSAAAVDPASAELVGIDVASRYAWTFAIATAVGSIGGTLVGLSFSVDPVSGMGWLVRAFTVVVLGGLGSMPGTMVGALVVGLAETAGASAFGPQYRDVVVFGLLVVVLLVRPQGLSSLWPSLRAVAARRTAAAVG